MTEYERVYGAAQAAYERMRAVQTNDVVRAFNEALATLKNYRNSR